MQNWIVYSKYFLVLPWEHIYSDTDIFFKHNLFFNEKATVFALLHK